MGVIGRWYEANVVTGVVEKACGARDLARARRRVAAGLAGEVVEIGFGTGHNVPHLPPAVAHLHAVEPQSAGQRIGADTKEWRPVTRTPLLSASRAAR